MMKNSESKKKLKILFSNSMTFLILPWQLLRFDDQNELFSCSPSLNVEIFHENITIQLKFSFKYDNVGGTTDENCSYSKFGGNFFALSSIFSLFLFFKIFHSLVFDSS